MHSHARTSAEIDDNVILYRSLLSLILSPEIARRSSQKRFNRVLKDQGTMKAGGPRITRMAAKIQSEKESFALICVIRGQIARRSA
jgi:hypothetical protein